MGYDERPCHLGLGGERCAHEHVAAHVPRGREGDKSNRQCPCHDDRKASLSINGGTEGQRIVWNCGSGCDVADIRAALLDLGVHESCIGNYGLPKREIRPGMRIAGHDPELVAAAKRSHAIGAIPLDLDGKLYKMCVKAVIEGDGDLPGDPLDLLPVNSDDFYGLATRTGLGRYRYELFGRWLKLADQLGADGA